MASHVTTEYSSRCRSVRGNIDGFDNDKYTVLRSVTDSIERMFSVLRIQVQMQLQARCQCAAVAWLKTYLSHCQFDAHPESRLYSYNTVHIFPINIVPFQNLKRGKEHIAAHSLYLIPRRDSGSDGA
jgi:hypothetical protein